MVSVEEAKSLITLHAHPLPTSTINLQQALGAVLNQDVFSPIDVPGFLQSAMDGFCFRFQDWLDNKKLKVVGEIQAGEKHQPELLPGQAIRIFTGAPLPLHADTVVMQEKVLLSDESLTVLDSSLQIGRNVKKIGSEIGKGALALPKGMLLTPASIGFLAGMGISTVSVFGRPKVAILVTGKEVRQPGTSPIQHGEVYDANSFSIKAVLQQCGILEVNTFYTDDDLSTTAATLKSALEQSDMVLLSGGISAGKYDYVLQAASSLQVNEIFYKVKQKPGKPLYFGKKDNKLIFGLPGNPAAALVCMYEYVLLAVSLLSAKSYPVKKTIAPISSDYYKSAGPSIFLKGFYTNNIVTILTAQESYRLSSFAASNCLIYLNEAEHQLAVGDLVEVHLLPEVW